MGTVYITGDRHGNLEEFEDFCKDNHTTKEDIMIILGDSGINYYVSIKDNINNDKKYWDSNNKRLKNHLSKLPITFLIIHGNHEARAETIHGYKPIEWNGGIVNIQEKYPNLLFAKDGENYLINNKRFFCIGGAYSVDKYQRIALNQQGRNDVLWFNDEQVSEEDKNRINKIITEKNDFDYVLSHTCPYKYRPIETFLDFIDQSSVDTSMEEWLNDIEEKIQYKKWFCGHYHTNKIIDNIVFLFEEII